MFDHTKADRTVLTKAEKGDYVDNKVWKKESIMVATSFDGAHESERYQG